MASPIPRPDPSLITTGDCDSDYGSEFDNDAVQELLSQAESQPLSNLVIESIEEPLLNNEAASERPLARLARVTRSAAQDSSSQHDRPSVQVEYDQRDRVPFPSTREPERIQPEAPLSPEPSTDTRSPLLRFRTPPKKTLSVTDLVSPAWCELQYWYSLTKYGRIRRTPAMKQGSSVHKALEEQVHTEVPIDVETKEDRFGLRIWNIIQGLQTLRRTGMTRELEVWGLVDGEVVNGIIDEVTISCPDERMESEMCRQAESGAIGVDIGKKNQAVVLEKDQRTLTDFLTNSQAATVLENGQWSIGSLHEKPRTFYLKDIKTRKSKSVPEADGGRLRPVRMQLMLYHRLLSALATNNVPAEQIFRRYNIHPHCPFSDTFIAQIATLDFDATHRPSDTPDLDDGTPPSQDAIDTILTHNTVESLWTLMIAEFAAALPSTSISNLLTAEFRTANGGSFLGHRSFAFDPVSLETYLVDEMRWWKGARATKGVELEEAYKCGLCEFAAECTWRIDKVEEGVRKVRERNNKKKGKQGSEI